MDRANQFLSIIISLKSVLGSAKRLFLNAKYFFVLSGIADTFNAAKEANCQELNNFVRLICPSSCLHIPGQVKFTTQGDVWNAQTRDGTYSTLES